MNLVERNLAYSVDSNVGMFLNRMRLQQIRWSNEPREKSKLSSSDSRYFRPGQYKQTKHQKKKIDIQANQ